MRILPRENRIKSQIPIHGSTIPRLVFSKATEAAVTMHTIDARIDVIPKQQRVYQFVDNQTLALVYRT